MSDDRLMSEAARRARERRNNEDGAARHRPDDAPPPSSTHRRLLGWLGGDIGCAHCARRAQAAATTLDLARTSCQFLAATWVVLTLGDR